MSKKKVDREANVKQPEGVRIQGGSTRQRKTQGVKVSSGTNTANPDRSKGVEIHGGSGS